MERKDQMKAIRQSTQVAFLFGLIAMSFAACKGGDSGTSVVYPPAMPPSCFLSGSTVTGAQATACCTADGNPRTPLPSGCPRPQGVTATASTMVSFNSAAATSREALATAESVVGRSSVAKNNLAPATAATTNAAQTDLASIQGGGVGIEKIRNAMKDKANQRGGGGAIGGSVASGGFDVKPTSVLGGDASTQAATALGGAGSVPSGGVGGRRVGSGPALDDYGGGLSATNGMLDMGGGREPSSDGPMIGNDPEDYFTMLKPMDDIFKVVERRYGEKARGWALRDAADVAARSRLTKIKQ